jgi:hypothetical protein
MINLGQTFKKEMVVGWVAAKSKPVSNGRERRGK